MVQNKRSRLILDEKIRRVLAKTRTFVLYHLYEQFACYLIRVLAKTRLIFSRINGPIELANLVYSRKVALRLHERGKVPRKRHCRERDINSEL